MNIGQLPYLLLFLLLAVGWLRLNLLATGLILSSDRARSGQKAAQVALVWLIPGFFYLARWMHREYLSEDSYRAASNTKGLPAEPNSFLLSGRAGSSVGFSPIASHGNACDATVGDHAGGCSHI